MKIFLSPAVVRALSFENASKNMDHIWQCPGNHTGLFNKSIVTETGSWNAYEPGLQQKKISK